MKHRASRHRTGTLVLIGAMGSGKSHIARDLARLSGWPARDLDALIVSRAGRSIADIFRDEGEAAFRALESDVLRDTLQRGGIIATGGGIVTQKINRTLLQSCGAPVVYLRARAATLAERIRLQPGTRPLIDSGGALNYAQTLARVKEILRARAALYEECATHIFDTDGCVPRELARAMWHAIHA